MSSNSVLCGAVTYPQAHQRVATSAGIVTSGSGQYEVAWTKTLFTPETPKVCCGLKHFTHPSISIVVIGNW